MAPVPLMRKDKDSFVFETETLKNLLSDPKLKDLPIAIISIAGKFRLGKSFLISHAVAKLKGIEVNSGSAYFRFKKSSDRQTEGIDVWDEPFTVTRSNGEKLVVLFMDTQGTFDCETSFKENNLIFGVSATISSMLMYNLMRQLDTSDMENLAYFVEFGLAAQNSSGHKVYQDIIYVIRDWVNTTDFAYGFEGGNKMLQTHHQTSIPSIQDLHDKITQSFKSRNCFLCPPPGERVHEDGFNGNLQELDSKFQKYFQLLIDTVLDVDRIQPKMFNGKPLLCKDAPSVMNILFESLNKAPEPKDLLELTGKSTHEAAKQVAFNSFIEQITELEKNLPALSIEQSDNFLREAMNSASDIFSKTPRLGQDLFEREYAKDLIEMMKKRCSEVHISHLTILKTIALENDNADLAQQYAQMEKQQEMERQKNEARSEQINAMKEKQQLMYETMDAQLKNIKAQHEKETTKLNDQMEKDREEFEKDKVALENQLLEHVNITKEHIEQMELQKRRMEEEFREIEKANEKKLADLNDEYKRVMEKMEEQARERQEEFEMKMDEVRESEELAEIERKNERARAEERRNMANTLFETEMENTRAKREQERKEELERLEEEKKKDGDCSIM